MLLAESNIRASQEASPPPDTFLATPERAKGRRDMNLDDSGGRDPSWPGSGERRLRDARRGVDLVGIDPRPPAFRGYAACPYRGASYLLAPRLVGWGLLDDLRPLDTGAVDR